MVRAEGTCGSVVTSAAPPPTTRPWTIVLMVVLLFAGGVSTRWAVQRVDRNLHEEVLSQAQRAARLFSGDQFPPLRDAEETAHLWGQERVREQLGAVLAEVDSCEFVAWLGAEDESACELRTRRAVPGLSSEQLAETVRKGVSATREQLLEGRDSVAWGPVPGPGGSWVLGLIPICHSSRDKVDGFLCLGFAVHDWRWRHADEVLQPGLISVLLGGLILAGASLCRWRDRREANVPRWMWHLEPMLAAVAGLVLTFGAVRAVDDQQSRAGQQVALYGLLLTGSAALVIELVYRRREELKRMVLERTAALLESQQRMRSLLASMEDLVFVLDRDLVFQDFHQPWTDALLLQPDQFVGRPFELIDFPEPARSLVYPALQRTVQTGSSTNVQYYLDFLPERRWYDLHINTYVDDSGATLGVICVARDITELKRVEQSLKASEENFRTAFESIGDMQVVVAPDGRILHGNAALRHKLGYRLEELVDRHFQELYPAEMHEEAVRTFTLMLGREQESCLLPMITRRGARIDVETRVWAGKWDGADCVYCISKDLTAQQAALRLLERVFEANPAPMALSPLSDRTLIKVNRAFCAVTGYERDEVLGKTTAEIGLFADPTEVETAWNKVEAEGSVKDAEMAIRTKSGEIRLGLFFGETITIEDDAYFLSTMVDITAQKHTEHELRETQRTLEQRVQHRTAELEQLNRHLMDEIGRRQEVETALQEHRHDLRRLASQLTLAEEEQRNELAVQLHDTIGQELAMARLRLEHVRDGRCSDGQRDLEVVAALVDSAVRQVHHLTHGLGANVLSQLGLPAAIRSVGHEVAQSHGLEFVYQQSGDYQRPAREIEVHLFRAVRELVYNVVKHARASRLQVRLQATAERVSVDVKDDGCGFEPAARSSRHDSLGGGFGLFSIRERLATLGGSLALLSAIGQGTTVTVIVPVQHGPPAPHASAGNGDQA